MSGDYKLEAIISDDRLDKQFRKNIASAKINFRFSLEQPLPCELAYAVPSLIHTEAPPTRQDPPFLFTAFAVVLISILFAAFLAGLGYQKVNLNLLPTDGTGLFLNGIFLGALGIVLFMLFKFWVSWTFIQTMQYFLLASKFGFMQFCRCRWPPTTPSSTSARTDSAPYITGTPNHPPQSPETPLPTLFSGMLNAVFSIPASREWCYLVGSSGLYNCELIISRPS